ncbi:hypothetical protein [Candidatus Nitrosotalea bavarica]|uniref:hypothetical protein n=1 Tax=Candidatus Nitrosotalea bavarica TaxID=1903277 RepID=UPI000C700130|nr:hypothetical protein [Candidatus Nitrosotalea bavarica]
MSEKIIPDMLIKGLQDGIKIFEGWQQSESEFAKRQEDKKNYDLEYLFHSFKTTWGMFSFCYQVMILQSNAINNLYESIDKLPDKKEFDDIKSELHKQKEKVISTLEPLKDLLDQTKEQSKRGNHVYR